MKNKILRFAPLIRVSTEGQEKNNVSIETQTERLKENVKSLGGMVSCLYKGQEHSTPKHDREIFNQLLRDSGKNLFDAVIVYDCSRWSRDNKRNKEGLEELRENGIRFFVGMTEYDLHDPNDCLFIGMSTEFSEYQAALFKMKSRDGKITRIRNNEPALSKKKLIFGRTFNKATKQWGLKPDIKEKMESIAERFIKGENRAVLAKELGITSHYLWKIFKYKCGDTWIRKFKRGKEIITLKITVPPLLDDEMIKAVRKRIDANKNTSLNSQTKFNYPLARMIRCIHCGNTLTGYPSPKGKRYYRHIFAYQKEKKCNAHYYVPAKEIEDVVMARIFHMYLDIDSIEKAVYRAYPDKEKYKKLMGEEELDSKELIKLQKEKNYIVKSIRKDIISDEDAKQQMNEIKERIELIEKRKEERKPLLEKAPPSREDIEEETDFIRHIVTFAIGGGSLAKMEDKRKIFQATFDGKGLDGRRLGVYMMKENGTLKYAIHARLSNNLDEGWYNSREWLTGDVSTKMDEFQMMLHNNPDYAGDYNPFSVKVKRKASRKHSNIKKHIVGNRYPCKDTI